MDHESPSLDRAARMTLVAAPLLTLLARTLTVPWDDSHPAKYVQHLADAPTRSDIGASLVVLAAALSIPATLYLTALARAHRARLGLVGGVLAVAGWVGVAGVGTKSLDAGQIVRHSSRDTAISVTHHLAVDVHTIDLLTLAGVVGFVLLALCLRGDGRIPRAATVLIGLGGAATMFTSQGPIPALVLGASLTLFLGQSWLATVSSGSTPIRSQPPTLDQPYAREVEDFRR
jgi:hypothetical protein